MGDIGKYFNRSEFACKCGCGFDGKQLFGSIDNRVQEQILLEGYYAEKDFSHSSPAFDFRFRSGSRGKNDYCCC
jgi:hypothetical protein